MGSSCTFMHLFIVFDLLFFFSLFYFISSLMCICLFVFHTPALNLHNMHTHTHKRNTGKRYINLIKSHSSHTNLASSFSSALFSALKKNVLFICCMLFLCSSLCLCVFVWLLFPFGTIFT